jgi:sulfite reductase (ferredoxin)
VPTFLGNIKNENAVKLAGLLASFGPNSIRAALGQNLRLRNIPESHLGNVWTILRDFGDVASSSRLIANAVACTGANTCKLGICMPRGALSAIAQRLTTSGLSLDDIGDFRLNLSGCPNSCGQHMLGDLGFYGNAASKNQRMYPAYAVVAGARLAEAEARLGRHIGRVSARDLPVFVEKVAALWISKKKIYSSFADFVDGKGEQELRALAETFHDIPDFADDENYYFDWGAEKAFSLAGRGAAECSASLYDLIEIDLKNARRQQEESAAGSEKQGESLSRVVFLSARSLLITRGIKAETAQSVFDNFHKHFILAGLVDRKFEAIVTAARDNDAAALQSRRADVSALLETIEALYRSMDDTLRFAAKSATT